jgi:hypothetical protein
MEGPINSYFMDIQELNCFEQNYSNKGRQGALLAEIS